MKKGILIALLVAIASLGLFLRLTNYASVPPFNETKDEFFYPWQIISWVKTGVPSAWSPFVGYTQVENKIYWGEQFRMVSPWMEKPPLYSVLTGGLSLLMGEDDFGKVRLSTIRLVPIALNTISIILIGLLAAVVFTPTIGILSAILYATIPMVVLANRLSVVENLLIPISLSTLLAFYTWERHHQLRYLILAAIGCAAALMTKQVGIALPASLLWLLFQQRKWKGMGIIAVATGLGALIHPLLGAYFGWELYAGVMEQYRIAISIGLPETLYSIFFFPVIGHKEGIFLDGAMLLGYLSFFMSPFWIGEKYKKAHTLLIYPFVYFGLLTLLEGGKTWFGWHLFPLYPFVIISLAVLLYRVATENNILQYVLTYGALGASTLRFLLIAYPEHIPAWPTYVGFIGFLFLGISIIPIKIVRSYCLIGLGVLFIAVNIFVIMNFPLYYPSRLQPVY